jgi:hypothetical protein
MQEKYKNIFSIRVARKLIKLGERVVDIKPNLKKAGFTVYVFELSPTFDENMKIATKHKNEAAT